MQKILKILDSVLAYVGGREELYNEAELYKYKIPRPYEIKTTESSTGKSRQNERESSSI